MVQVTLPVVTEVGTTEGAPQANQQVSPADVNGELEYPKLEEQGGDESDSVDEAKEDGREWQKHRDEMQGSMKGL
jgi:hypothetical protein